MSSNTSTTVQDAVAGVRQSMSDLDAAIGALRAEATRLRESADSRLAVALLERPLAERGPSLADLLATQTGTLAVDLAETGAPDEEPGEPGTTPEAVATEERPATDTAATPALVSAPVAVMTPAQVADVRPQPTSAFAWNPDDAHEDDDAFDKFFGADVEPEPAQRWLLDDR